ncbi:hypothetical protein R3W88_033683 [Solanum pinnatisectum]|uniref:Uncharacterized protein n=1 Tax=Solanum pinnatisectum TaxID=50273 RepID=A0AAV9K259_9SOLN|nr:hypothetical protein R3W88_033683 [Solanum pinnatisectum]
MSTLVYAKCSAQERLQLWEAIYSVGYNLNLPWLVGGDSNVVLSDKDKIGCLLIYSHDYEDIFVCINSCELFDSDVKESPFTRWNGRINNTYKFKRLDRIVINQEFLNVYGIIDVQHLARFESNHAHLLFSCGDQNSIENVFSKMKKTKHVLSLWSNEKYGDIFKQHVIREEIVRMKESLFKDQPPTTANRSI